MSAVCKLVLDCTKPFDPVSFMGKGWKELERDERAYAMTQVDFSKCQFLTCLKEGEDYFAGEEKLRRLKDDYPQLIRHGGNQFLALWEDYKQNGDNSVLDSVSTLSTRTLLGGVATVNPPAPPPATRPAGSIALMDLSSLAISSALE